MSEIRDWLEEIMCRAGLDGLPRPATLAGGTVACLLVVTAVYRWGPWAEAPAAASEGGVASAVRPAAAPSVPDSVTVHVVGAVATPGVFSLPSGSRACDAIAAAGGLREDAEAAGVNLARIVADGEQIVIPVKGEGGPGTASTGGGARGGKVNINTSDVAELDTLPGVGPATADKIVSDREENGPFRRPEDLMRVPGIGAKRFEQLKDLITTG